MPLVSTQFYAEIANDVLEQKMDICRGFNVESLLDEATSLYHRVGGFKEHQDWVLGVQFLFGSRFLGLCASE